MHCRYEQADILFYIQNEYDNLRKDFDILDIETQQQLLDETKNIVTSKFIQILNKKNLIIFDKNNLLKINNNQVLKKDKYYDFTKIKRNNLQTKNAVIKLILKKMN